jgi:hypothetical protein
MPVGWTCPTTNLLLSADVGSPLAWPTLRESYAANDVVTYNGSTYVATSANQGPSNPNPDVNPAWTLMAQQGATGPQGVSGLPGATGASGSQGPKGDKGDTGTTGATGPPGPQGVKGDAGPAGPIGPQGAQGPGGSSFASNFQAFTAVGFATFVVPSGVNVIQVEVVGGGGAGGFNDQSATISAGGGGSGGYQKVVLSVIPGASYQVFVGPAGFFSFTHGFQEDGQDSYVQAPPIGTYVACGAGGGGGGVAAGGSFDIRNGGLVPALSSGCARLGLSGLNILTISGQPGQNCCTTNSAYPGFGGAAVMLAAGAGGAGNIPGTVQSGYAAQNGYVLISW